MSTDSPARPVAHTAAHRLDRRTLVRGVAALGLSAAALAPSGGARGALVQDATPSPAASAVGATPTASPAPAQAVGVVYAMSNGAGPGANTVVAFARDAGGALSPLGAYPTGGLGTGPGHPPTLEPGTGFDPLVSNDALRASPDGRFLFAVNAGNDTVGVLRVEADYALTPVGTAPSGGRYPNSIAAFGDLLYVTNIGDPASGAVANVSGFRVGPDGALAPIPGSGRPLPDPAQSRAADAIFSPDGAFLVVTDLATNAILLHRVGDDGLLAEPIVTPSVGAGPFGARFLPTGGLVVAEAQNGGMPAGVGKSSVSVYALAPDGALTVVSPAVPNGRSASCWVTVSPDGRFIFASNTVDGTISGYEVTAAGGIELRESVAHAQPASFAPSSGPIDAAMSPDGGYLYQLYGGLGVVGAFRVETNGRLTPLTNGHGGGLPQLGTQGLVVL